MRDTRTALLLLGVLVLCAGTALAADDPPPKKSCSHSSAKTCAVICTDDDHKEIRVEVEEIDGESVVKVYEIQDGEPVLVKEFERDGDFSLKALTRIDGLEDIYVTSEGDDVMTWVVAADDDDDKVRIRKFFKGGDHAKVWTMAGSRTWLGVAMQNLGEQLGDYFEVDDGEGVLITEVIEGSPAEEAGLKAGDVIVRIDDEDIADTADLTEFVHDHEPGDEVTVHVKRDGRSRRFEATLAEREEDDLSWSFFDHDGEDFYISGNRHAPHALMELHDVHEDGLQDEIEELRADIEELKAQIEEMNKDR